MIPTKFMKALQAVYEREQRQSLPVVKVDGETSLVHIMLAKKITIACLLILFVTSIAQVNIDLDNAFNNNTTIKNDLELKVQILYDTLDLSTIQVQANSATQTLEPELLTYTVSNQTTEAGLDYVFENDVHMKIMFNDSFPKECIEPAKTMISSIILPQLSQKFWTPNINSTITISNITSDIYGGTASAVPLSLDSQGKATEINGTVTINNNLLILYQGKLTATSEWEHEFTHIFQMIGHSLGPNWLIESQASFMEHIIVGSNIEPNPNLAILADPYFSSNNPQDGIAFYLETKNNWMQIYSATEGWARLYIADNQILKKINDQLSNLPYYGWYNGLHDAPESSERYIRQALRDILGKTVIDNVNIAQWFDAHCFCDFGMIPKNKPYFRWAVTYQNNANKGAIMVYPAYFKNQNSTVDSTNMDFNIKIYNALTKQKLTEINATTALNPVILFSPKDLDYPKAISVKITATALGQTINQEKTFFDTSQKQQFIYKSNVINVYYNYDTSSKIKVAVENNTYFQAIKGTLSITSQTTTKNYTVNQQIFEIDQATLQTDGYINITYTGSSKIEIKNLILSRSTDDIILRTNQTLNAGPTTTHDYQDTWASSDLIINLTRQQPATNTYYAINAKETMNYQDCGPPIFSFSNAHSGSNNTLEYWSTDNLYNEEYPHKTLNNIKLDFEPPTGDITINGGISTSTSNNVILTLTAQDSDSGINSIRLSNEKIESNSTIPWQTFTSQMYWTLKPGNGLRTVYYQIKDNVGLTSLVYHQSTIVSLPTTTTPSPSPTPPPTTSLPTTNPTSSPTTNPTTNPTTTPTTNPTTYPTTYPTTNSPTQKPTTNPTANPTPTVPELSWLTIILCTIPLILVALALKKQKTHKKSTINPQSLLQTNFPQHSPK